MRKAIALTLAILALYCLLITRYSRAQTETPPSQTPTNRTNYALASNGGAAYASSTYPGYPETTANNGDRKGGINNYWNDAAPGNTFSDDWLRIDFNSSKTIDEIDVFTVQDAWSNPSEPTDTMTFTLYGLTAYEVQYWTGTSWANVPNGNVTANNLVWKKLTFLPVTTSKIRVLAHAAPDGYSRLAEVEAWGTDAAPRTNVALTSNGGTATASSTYTGYPASTANNGDRSGGVNNYWNDAAPGNTFSDCLRIDFSGVKTIDEIDVFTVQDNWSNPSEPTETMTFSLYGLTAYDVQYWNGSSWVTVPNGNVSGNYQVWKRFTFSPITTDKIRVWTSGAPDGYSRITEVEAYGVVAGGTGTSNVPPVSYSGGPYYGEAGAAIQTYGGNSYDPDGNISSYQWNFGDGATGVGASPTHYYANDGTYAVSLTVSDNLGTTNTSSSTVTVNASPQPVTISFDNLSTGAIVSNQYSQVTFSSENNLYFPVTTKVNCGFCETSSRPHFISSGSTHNHEVRLDFRQPVNNLTFRVGAFDQYYNNFKVDVFTNGNFTETVPGDGYPSYYFLTFDLRRFSNVTRIRIYNIVDPYGLGFDDFTFTPVGKVESVSLEQMDSPLDTNPNASGGLSPSDNRRIFSDKQSPADTVNRRRVRVRANTSLGANKTVFFKAFDVDDPSTDAAPVDSNGTAGGDNRGAPATAYGGLNALSAQTDSNGVATVEFTTTMQPGDNFRVAASTDQAYLNGLLASNVNVRDSAGTLLPTDKAKVTQMLTVWRSVHIEVDSMGPYPVPPSCTDPSCIPATPRPANNANTLALSSWPDSSNPNQVIINIDNRPLRDGSLPPPLETNRFQNGRIQIGDRPPFQYFRVVSNDAYTVTVEALGLNISSTTHVVIWDDDDYNSDDGPNLDGDYGEDIEALAQTFSLVQNSDFATQNVFAAAYIRPVYDGGGPPTVAGTTTNNNSEVSFSLNVVYPMGVNNQINVGRNSEANERDDFWVAYVLIGYQPDSTEDEDPDREGAAGGYTSTGTFADDIINPLPSGGFGSIIFLETQRDLDKRGQIENRGYDLLVRSLPHELGHQFGLRGDDPNIPEFGIMNPTGLLTFGPRHLNLLRFRIKSPGQL